MKWLNTYFNTFKNIFNYQGTATRGEVWNFVLLTMLLEFVWYMVTSSQIIVIFHIVAYVTFIALAVRRCRDVNRSPWLCLFLIVPIINFLFILYLLFASKD